MIKNLLTSGYEGAISEAGLGVPLQAMIMEVPGASNFLLRGECPYNQAFQVKLVDRSVAEENVVATAHQLYDDLCRRGFPREGKKLFAAAISGTHVYRKKGAQTHGWMAIITNLGSCVVHFVINKNLQKKTAIRKTGLLTGQILEAALSGKTTNNVSNTYYTHIDVLRWPNATIYDDLTYCLSRSDAVYFDKYGMMQRPADILRKATHIYRGSFNPVTNAHLAIGGDALFEISANTFDKGNCDYMSLMHRIRMLNAVGKGVLITKSHPHFINFHTTMIQEYGLPKTAKYIMGADVFNKVAKTARDTGDWYMKDVSKLNIVVNNRDNIPLDTLSQAVHMKVEVVNSNNSFSSTKARAGDHTGLDPKVSKYIKDNKLYV